MRDVTEHHIGPAALVNPAQRNPLTLTLTRFACLDQSDEIRVLFGLNSEDDEPYAVVFAVDLMINSSTSVANGAINSKASLIGPLADVDVDDDSAAPHNIIWGLSNAPSPISSADNLIVLVAMMENDSSSPDQVRSTLETAARASLITNLPAFMATGAIPAITRQELVNRMIAGMAGAMGVAKVGFPDPDDNIGAIQELRFTQSELDDASTNFVNAEKSLTFEGDDAKYVTHFKVFREIGASLQPA